MGMITLEQEGRTSNQAKGTGGAMHVIEQGLGPGEGPNLPLAVEERFVLDQTIFTLTGSTAPYATNNRVIKAAPGFVKRITVVGLGAAASGATHIFVYDNTAASGIPVDVIPRPATGSVISITYDEDFYVGITIGIGTLAVATASITPTLAAVGAADQAIQVNVAYR